MSAGSIFEADWTGRLLGDFQVMRLLGQGGMGRVYLARQISLDRLVALKVVRSDSRSRDDLRQRLRSEALAVARLNHPGIVQVYSICDIDDSPTLVMEYVEGRTLKDLVDRRGPLDSKDCIHFLRQVGAALKHAGDAGIIHRDIKPENILVTRQGTAKVADFGLARVLDRNDSTLHMTQDGSAMGTPLYMSPEQVEGKRLDARSDLYSLGVTAFFMLTGRPPFKGATAMEVAVKQVREEPESLAIMRPDVSVMLCDLVHRLLRKDPAARPSGPAAFLEELDGTTGVAASNGLLRWIDIGRARWSAACLSMALALGAGISLGAVRGWQERVLAHEMYTGSLPETGIDNGDSGAEKLSGEAALRQAVEIYLSGRVEGATVDAGLVVCLDLGLMYLQQERWDEALRFFGRLDQPKQALHFQALGKLGSGIALALENKPAESVKEFRELGPLWRDEILRERAWRSALDLQIPRRPARFPGGPPDQTPLRYWLGKAIEVNRKNGLPDADIPPILKRLTAEVPGPKIGTPARP